MKNAIKHHPLTIIRLWPDQYVDPESWHSTLTMLKQYPKSSDEIWLCTAINYPIMETHTHQALVAAQAAKEARDADFLVCKTTQLLKMT